MAWTREGMNAEALEQRIRFIREDVQRLTDAPDGPSLIALAARMASTQADLARLSGLTANTVTAIKKGKRPTAAQRAAIYWAIAKAGGL